MDKRIAEAFQTIGSIAENDLTPERLGELEWELRRLYRFCHETRWAKTHRFAGEIEPALEAERAAQEHYLAFPDEYRW